MKLEHLTRNARTTLAAGALALAAACGGGGDGPTPPPPPVKSVSISCNVSPTTVTKGQSVNYNCTGTGNNGATVNSVSADYAGTQLVGGSTSINGTFTPSASGTFTARVSGENGTLSNSYSQGITVGEAPKVASLAIHVSDPAGGNPGRVKITIGGQEVSLPADTTITRTPGSTQFQLVQGQSNVYNLANVKIGSAQIPLNENYTNHAFNIPEGNTSVNIEVISSKNHAEFTGDAKAAVDRSYQNGIGFAGKKIKNTKVYLPSQSFSYNGLWCSDTPAASRDAWKQIYNQMVTEGQTSGDTYELIEVATVPTSILDNNSSGLKILPGNIILCDNNTTSPGNLTRFDSNGHIESSIAMARATDNFAARMNEAARFSDRNATEDLVSNPYVRNAQRSGTSYRTATDNFVAKYIHPIASNAATLNLKAPKF